MRKLFILSGLLLIPAGCTPPPQTESGVAALERFQSGEELREYIAKQVQSQRQNTGGFGFLDLLTEAFVPTPSLAPDATNGAQDDSGGSRDYSSTNVQEEGVDESDFVKNDGEYIYVLRNGSVRIVRAAPPGEMAQVASVAVEGYGDALYLVGDRLLAVTQLGGGGYYDDAWGGEPTEPIAVRTAQDADVAPWPGGDYRPRVRLTIIGVSNPAEPVVLHELTMDGSLNTSRVIESRLHVVLTLYPILPDPLTESQVREQPVEEILPDYMATSGDGASSQSNLVEPTDVFYPVDADGYGMTVVATIDVASETPQIRSTAIMADAATVYVSPKALYVTDANYNFFGQLRETTDIYKFDLTGEQAVYVAAGSVEGRLLSQYSLGEYEDHLRVATTTEEWGGVIGIAVPVSSSANGGTDDAQTSTDEEPASEDAVPSGPRNNVYVLAQEEEKLNVVGSLEGIAPGERIYAARFVGPRGFLVTFVQIDPLFTLDLAVPANPKVVGELKVDGVSDYIHILDANHLLTVGRAAVSQGDFALFQGVQLSVFDITDYANPVLKYHVELGDRGTYTEVQYNPKAVTFYPSQSLMALPIDLYEGGGDAPWDYGYYTFSGIYVFRVTPENGFDQLGRISTRESEYASYYGTGSRGVFIGENVYAVTGSGVRAAPISDVNSVPWALQLPAE